MIKLKNFKIVSLYLIKISKKNSKNKIKINGLTNSTPFTPVNDV